MPYKDPQKRKEAKRRYYLRKKHQIDIPTPEFKFPPIKLPKEMKETKYSGYYITNDGKAYRKPGKRDQYSEINEYGLIYLNVSYRGNPRDKKYQYESVNISLRDENEKYIKQIKKSIHQLVAETFIPNPNNYTEIDHIDRNKLNNHYTNLRWVSRFDNMSSWERNQEYRKKLSENNSNRLKKSKFNI